MRSNKRDKLAIFKLFSQNLEWVKEHPSISFKPDFSKGYICPLCFDVFFERDLDHTLPNCLTAEHIPPFKLGGKPLALTCRSCNSKSGRELDVQLLNKLLVEDAKRLLPNSKAQTSFELNGNIINGTLEVDNNGKVIIDLHRQRSNPHQSNQFMKDMFPPRTIYNPLFYPDKALNNKYESPTFLMKFKETTIDRRAEIGLLRIAYLYAYATLGNGFFINGGLYKVREQILNPEKDILPKVFWLNVPFPKESEGVNIITLPKEMQSFLVIFNLKTPSIERQFAIVLPGPSSPSIKVYDYLSNELCVGDGTDFLNCAYEHLPKLDYLRRKELAFASNWYWQEYTSELYQPNYEPKK